MQSFQVTVQNRLVSPTLEGKLPQAMYLMRFVLRSFRFFRVQMARVAGLAFQPEHVESPELPAVPARV
jgi:hypothetical protein